MRVALLTLAVVVASGCTARRSEPLRGPVALDSAKQKSGQVLYFRHCHNCHPGGEAGLGPALNDKLAPPIAIKAQIRAGIGAMPAFPPDRLSDEEADALIDFMLAMRNHGPLLNTD
jgi:mono/diheme cytochrome c family protein